MGNFKVRNFASLSRLHIRSFDPPGQWGWVFILRGCQNFLGSIIGTYGREPLRLHTYCMKQACKKTHKGNLKLSLLYVMIRRTFNFWVANLPEQTRQALEFIFHKKFILPARIEIQSFHVRHLQSLHSRADFGGYHPRLSFWLRFESSIRHIQFLAIRHPHHHPLVY